MTVTANSQSIVLKGLDGSNPLAFLTAIGLLRSLTLMHPDVDIRLRWAVHQAAWRPELSSNSFDFDDTSLCDELADWLASPPQLELLETIGDNLTLSPRPLIGGRIPLRSDTAKTFYDLARCQLEKANTGDPASVTALDFLAAFGSDATCQPHAKDQSLMQDTALRTMSGAGHQHFIKFMREIIANTSASHLYASLFLPWTYEDEGRGMNLRWDPIDDRRYAMRWKNPSSDPAMTMRGANRLAIEAIPLFPTAPVDKTLQTTGFRSIPRQGTFWSWPIWTPAIPLAALRSLLQHSAILETSVPDALALGVATVFRSQRITVGKFRNFTPAKPAR